MKIGILVFTRKIPEHGFPTSYGSRRIFEAAQKKGHAVQMLYEPLFTFDFTQNLPPTPSFAPPDKTGRGPASGGKKRGSIQYDGETLGEFDLILARAAITGEPSLHTVTAEILKNAGYCVVNGMPTFSVSKNKLAMTMLLDQKQIPQPRSIIVRHPKNARAAAEQLGYPVIIKIAFGTHGRGVFLAKDQETMQPIVDYLNVRDRNPVILQEFIKPNAIRDGLEKYSNGSLIRSDLRIFVVGDKIVAAMERVASETDFRANAHLNGSGRPVELTDEERAISLKAAQAFDLDVAGVDIIRSDRGPLVLEVNSNPGFEELEKATKIDVASHIIEYLESLV